MSLRETIEWIELTERVPEDDRLVLVALGESDCGDWATPSWIGYYDADTDQWLSSGDDEIDVVRWAEMPRGIATSVNQTPDLCQICGGETPCNCNNPDGPL